MALGNVFLKDSDNNIGRKTPTNIDQVCGLLFDISGQGGDAFWSEGTGSTIKSKWQNTIVELSSLEDAEAAGIVPHEGEITATAFKKDVLSGIPYRHIKDFFNRVGGRGRLFVAFADCSSNWDAVIDMQKAANGEISQIGIWTEKEIWQNTDSEDPYSLQLIGDINAVGLSLANNYFAPVSILLSANSAKIKGAEDGTKVALNRIPTCQVDARYVSVLLSQPNDPAVHAMQASLTSTTPVGMIGLALGSVAMTSVGMCIGFVGGTAGQFYNGNLASYVPAIEFGFGDSTVKTDEITAATPYEALTFSELDKLDDNGYIFMRRFAGFDGVYFNYDTTCSDKDYCTISRNRTINKSRRLVRRVLLPYVNSPVIVDPATGQLSPAQITEYYNTINTVLTAMATAGEISGVGAIVIPAEQNVLKEHMLKISYSIIPLGCAKAIYVTEGLAIKQ